MPPYLTQRNSNQSVAYAFFRGKSSKVFHLDVPARNRVIVARDVVTKPRLLVKALARQYYDAPPS